MAKKAKRRGPFNLPAKFPMYEGRADYLLGSDGIEVSFWCPFCVRRHNHSMDRDQYGIRKAAHRASHCITGSNSPHDDGYYIYLPPRSARPTKYRQMK